MTWDLNFVPYKLTHYINLPKKIIFKIWVKQGLGTPDGLSAAKITMRSDFLLEIFALKLFGLTTVSVTFNWSVKWVNLFVATLNLLNLMFLDESVDPPMLHKTKPCWAVSLQWQSYRERQQPNLLNKDFNIVIETSKSQLDF